MNLIVLRTWTRFLQPVMLLFAVFLLLRGHDEPGGGFVGGLMASAAFSLAALAYGVEEARREIRFTPQQYMATGLLLALASGLVGTFGQGRPLFSSVWAEWSIPLIGKLKVGTPLVFDIGVFLVVVGVTLVLVLTLLEENDAG